MSHYIIAGHEDGSVSQFDAKTGELLYNTQVHEEDMLSKDTWKGRMEDSANSP